MLKNIRLSSSEPHSASGSSAIGIVQLCLTMRRGLPGVSTTLSSTLHSIALNWAYVMATRRLAILYISRMVVLSFWAAMIWIAALGAILMYGRFEENKSLLRQQL